MIIVTGATGNVGSGVVARLRELGEDVRAVIPPGETPPWLPEDGLEIVEATFDDPDAIERAARGAKGYFLMSPPHERQIRWQRTQVDAAVRAGVSRVIKLSSYEAAPDSSWNMGRWHWDGELALLQSGLPHAILRPQYFQENLLLAVDRFRAGRLPTYIPSGRLVGAVHAGDVSDVAATLLTSGELNGQIVVPTGPETITTADAAAAVAAALGIPVEVEYRDSKQARKDLKGRPSWFVDDLISICQFCSAEVNDVVQTITGHPARSIAEVARHRLSNKVTAA
jgi:uncharacterized protein YbjT (DUF2867 family)